MLGRMPEGLAPGDDGEAPGGVKPFRLADGAAWVVHCVGQKIQKSAVWSNFRRFLNT
jgi:hypothetical protein